MNVDDKSNSISIRGRWTEKICKIGNKRKYFYYFCVYFSTKADRAEFFQENFVYDRIFDHYGNLQGLAEINSF